MTSSSTYYYTKAMTDLFVNTGGDGSVAFQSIDSMADFWIVSFGHLPYQKYSLKSQIILNVCETVNTLASIKLPFWKFHS